MVARIARRVSRRPRESAPPGRDLGCEVVVTHREFGQSLPYVAEFAGAVGERRSELTADRVPAVWHWQRRGPCNLVGL